MKKPLLFLFVIFLAFALKAQNLSVADTNCLPVPWVHADLLENGNILATWDKPCDTCNNVIYRVAYVDGFNPCSGEDPSEGTLTIIAITSNTAFTLTEAGEFPPGAYAIAIQVVYESCYSEWTNSNVVYTGDNWWDQTFQLDINVTLEDGGNPEGTNFDVHGINCLYDSLNYFLQSGSDGSTLFDSVMKGTYDITVSKTGYQVAQINDFYLWQDSTINVELAIDSSAIQNFSIDPLTSIATWDLATDSPGERDAEYFKIFLDGVLSDSIGMDERSYFYRCLQFGQEYDAGISAVFQWGESDTAEINFTSSYLVPPAKPVTVYEEGWDEVAFWLHIHQTCDTMDFPEGLMSFNLYRDGMFFGTVPWDPNPGDSIPIVDKDLDPGTYIYCVTAKYNLAPYGYPGQTAESGLTCDTVTVIYGFELPFIEDWNSGNFDYNDWRLQSSGNNWVVTSQDGNPAPSAQFNWEPTEENYSNTLTTTPLDASMLTEGHIWLDFQVKLDDNTASGTERFTVRLSNLDQTYNLYQFINEGSFDWDTVHLDITPYAMSNNFQIIFDANGENSSNIFNWAVDNIEVYRDCNLFCDFDIDIDTVGYDEYLVNFSFGLCDTTSPPGYWLEWDNGVNYSGIGTACPPTTAAIRWEAGMLDEYNGFLISKAEFFYLDNDVFLFNI